MRTDDPLRDYPFRSLIVNGREVALSDVVQGRRGNTPFEEKLYDFLRSWVGGEPAFSLQTSGSTGPPKIIVRSRAQFEGSARATIDALKLRRGGRSLICLDVSFVAGRMMVVRSLLAGLQMVAVEPVATPLERLPESMSFELVAVVPLQVDATLAAGGPRAFDHIAHVLIGGAEVGRHLEAKLAGATASFYATFGMTETVSHIALRRLNGHAASPHYVTLPGVAIGRDDRGCLVVETPYIGEKIITNDLIDLHSPTSFSWIGRADNVINTGGVKVSPEQLEATLLPAIQSLGHTGRFIITSRPDPRLGRQLVLVLEGSPLSGDEAFEFQRQLTAATSATVSRFQLPRAISTLPSFPSTKSGKIDRTAVTLAVASRV